LKTLLRAHSLSVRRRRASEQPPGKLDSDELFREVARTGLAICRDWQEELNFLFRLDVSSKLHPITGLFGRIRAQPGWSASDYRGVVFSEVLRGGLPQVFFPSSSLQACRLETVQQIELGEGAGCDEITGQKTPRLRLPWGF
jgi:hypothetical protein